MNKWIGKMLFKLQSSSVIGKTLARWVGSALLCKEHFEVFREIGEEKT